MSKHILFISSYSLSSAKKMCEQLWKSYKFLHLKKNYYFHFQVGFSSMFNCEKLLKLTLTNLNTLFFWNSTKSNMFQIFFFNFNSFSKPNSRVIKIQLFLAFFRLMKTRGVLNLFKRHCCALSHDLYLNLKNQCLIFYVVLHNVS